MQGNSLVDQAHQRIKEKIITLELRPGTKLEEKWLVSKLGIGRTPVREAIKMLTSEGLIVNHGSNAVFVKDMTLKSTRDLRSLLANMGELIFAAANPSEEFDEELDELVMSYKRLDDALRKSDFSRYVMENVVFHKTLAKVARNEYLDVFLDRIYNEEMRLSFSISIFMDQTAKKKHYSEVQRHHKKFIELLKSKDFEGLKKLWRDHLKMGQKAMFDYITSQG